MQMQPEAFSLREGLKMQYESDWDNMQRTFYDPGGSRR